MRLTLSGVFVVNFEHISRINYNIYLSNIFFHITSFFQFFLLIVATIFTILLFQTEICNSTRKTRCKEIDELSKRLRRIYYNETIRIVEDIELTTDIIEKIVGSVTEYNIEKAPDVGCFFVKVLWQANQTNLSPNWPKYFRILNFLSFPICSLRFFVDFWVVLLKKDVAKVCASNFLFLVCRFLWFLLDYPTNTFGLLLMDTVLPILS